MATLRQDLGPVTAYAYAVSEGYTGTEEEFAEVLANFADSAEQVAADAAQVALDKGAVHDDKEAVDSAEGRVTSAVNTFTTTTAPNAVTAVENAGTAQIGLVEAEGTRQIGLVADKGTEQVGTVSSEGTTQIGLVEAKGAEVIASIPGDYSTLQGDIASTYSSSSTYAVGDYVLYSGQLYRCTTAISTAEAWTSAKWTAVALGDDVSDLKSALSSAIEVETITSLNLLDLSAVTHGKYIAQNGTEYTSASYGYTDYIAVEEGETYTLQTGTDATFKTRSIKQMRFITAYDNSKAVMSSAGTESVLSYTVPNGVAFLRISVSDAYLTSGTYPVIYKGSALVPYIEYFAPYKQGTIKAEAYNKQYINEVIKEYIPKGLRYEFNLNNNYYQFDDDIQDMQDYTIAFRGTISSFVNLIIHRGYNETYGGRIYITNTDVNVYLGASTTVLSAQHGLTIKDYIFVVLTARNNNTASLKIYTNGGSYSKDVFSWDCRKGKLLAATSTSGGSVINDCELSYFCDGYVSDTQLYGDSYFSSAHTNRWTSYLNSSGYTNFLLNGFPGRNSATALASLKQVLECSNPKRVIWCLGMNDGDDNGGIDASWKACIEEVMQICESRAIELILATIPNVPTIDHSAKNAYVIASGYRYIDFASAVGASSDTTWFDDMLDDGVHPTIQGAIALFTQAIADVPELMQ